MKKVISKFFTNWSYVIIMAVSCIMLSMSNGNLPNEDNTSENNATQQTIADLASRIESTSSDLQYGQASYYAGFFIGRKTANGEVFTKDKYTCAHKTLPFGTKIKVTNLKTHKSIIVRVNDRGPFVKNRIVDLSLQGAKDLDMLQPGVIDISVEIVDENLSSLGRVENMEKYLIGDKYAYVNPNNDEKMNKILAHLTDASDFPHNADGLPIVNEEITTYSDFSIPAQ